MENVKYLQREYRKASDAYNTAYDSGTNGEVLKAEQRLELVEDMLISLIKKHNKPFGVQLELAKGIDAAATGEILYDLVI